MPWDAKDTFSGVIAYAEGDAGGVRRLRSEQCLRAEGRVDCGWRSFPTEFTAAQALVVRMVKSSWSRTWGGTAAFEHYWTPSLRTAWVFGYMNVGYS